MSRGVLLGAGSRGVVRSNLCGSRGAGAEEGIKISLTGVVRGHEAF